VGGVARNDGYVGGRGIVSICFLNFILGGTIRQWENGRVEDWIGPRTVDDGPIDDGGWLTGDRGRETGGRVCRGWGFDLGSFF
jgi:hypothetical protein